MEKKNTIPKYVDVIPMSDKIARKAWLFTYYILFRPFPGRFFTKWRNFVLSCFGAKIGRGSAVHASAIIPSPWKLRVGDVSCIGPKVELHIGDIIIGSKVTISQKTYLCGGSHDISKLNLPFISAPIIIEDYVWIAADAFIMMGVTIGEGAIVGAKAAVFKNVEPWTVVGGNPAKIIKKRIIA